MENLEQALELCRALAVDPALTQQRMEELIWAAAFALGSQPTDGDESTETCGFKGRIEADFAVAAYRTLRTKEAG